MKRSIFTKWGTIGLLFMAFAITACDTDNTDPQHPIKIDPIASDLDNAFFKKLATQPTKKAINIPFDYKPESIIKGPKGTMVAILQAQKADGSIYQGPATATFVESVTPKDMIPTRLPLRPKIIVSWLLLNKSGLTSKRPIAHRFILPKLSSLTPPPKKKNGKVQQGMELYVAKTSPDGQL